MAIPEPRSLGGRIQLDGMLLRYLEVNEIMMVQQCDNHSIYIYTYILYSTHLHDGFLSLPRAEPVYTMPRFVFWCYRIQESPVWGVCWCLVDIE